MVLCFGDGWPASAKHFILNTESEFSEKNGILTPKFADLANI
jgi:hypothetical protein